MWIYWWKFNFVSLLLGSLLINPAVADLSGEAAIERRAPLVLEERPQPTTITVDNLRLDDFSIQVQPSVPASGQIQSAPASSQPTPLVFEEPLHHEERRSHDSIPITEDTYNSQQRILVVDEPQVSDAAFFAELSQDGEAWQLFVLTPDVAHVFDCKDYKKIRIFTDGNTAPPEYDLSCQSRYLIYWNEPLHRWDVATITNN